jgi:hypothetical protein
VGQDAALEKSVELVLDEAGQLGAGAGLGVGHEAGRVLLHNAVQRGLLRAMALVVDRGASWRPLGLPADGLHASPHGFRGGGRSQAAHGVAIAPSGAYLRGPALQVPTFGWLPSCGYRLVADGASMATIVTSKLPVASDS